jgi:hypothetical protein
VGSAGPPLPASVKDEDQGKNPLLIPEGQGEQGQVWRRRLLGYWLSRAGVKR